VFELPLTSVTRRLPWRVPMAAGIALVAVGIAMSGALHAYALIAVGVAVWTTGEMCYSPVVNAAVAAFSPPGRTGRYQGYLSAVQAVGLALGPSLGLLLYGHDAPALWIACLAAGALASAGITLAGRAQRASSTA
jgi:MFS family permease